MRTMLEGQSGTGYPEGKFMVSSLKVSGFILKTLMAMVIVRLTFLSKPPASFSSLSVNLHIPVGHGNNLGGSINQ